MLLDFYTFLSYPFREYDIDFDSDYLFSSNILGFAALLWVTILDEYYICC